MDNFNCRGLREKERPSIGMIMVMGKEWGLGSSKEVR